MSQEYTISIFKPGDYQDTYGNYWCEVAFEGVSEPARWSMKEESVAKYKPGVSVYGHLEEATSKAGKAYNRFKVDQRPEGSQGPTGASKPSGGWTESPEKQQAINRAVALNNAVLHVNLLIGMSEGTFGVEDVLTTADTLYKWLSQTTIEEDIKNVTDSLEGIDY